MALPKASKPSKPQRKKAAKIITDMPDLIEDNDLVDAKADLEI